MVRKRLLRRPVRESEAQAGYAGVSPDGKRLSLKTAVYQRLRSEIGNGKVRPNDLLVERRIAHRFGTSKTPVREALMQLRQEGLVDVIPRGGYLVSKVSLQDVHNIFHLRQVLECEAVALTARHATTDDVRRLQHLLRRLTALVSRAAGRQDLSATVLAEYRSLNHSFHVALAAASGNALLSEFVDRLISSMDRLLTRDLLTASRLTDLEREHHPILDAVKRRDATAAVHLMAEHIRRTKDRVLENT